MRSPSHLTRYCVCVTGVAAHQMGPLKEMGFCVSQIVFFSPRTVNTEGCVICIICLVCGQVIIWFVFNRNAGVLVDSELQCVYTAIRMSTCRTTPFP